jgi:tyrosine-protein kinase Etk/Wzc
MPQPEKSEIDLRIVQDAVAADEEVEKIHFLEPFIILFKHKFLVLGIVSLAAIASIVVSLLLPPIFTATTRIMPPQQNQSVASAMLGQLGPLAAAASKDFGLRSTSDIYVVMLHSQTAADALIQRFSLKAVYKEELDIRAEQRLEDNTKIEAGKEGVISLSVSDRDPRRAADLANGYVEELLKLTQTLAVTEAGQRRLFFEREMQKASDELAHAEQQLKHTEQTTGIIQLESQSKAMIETVGELRARIAAKQVELQALRSFATEQNSQVDIARRELAGMQLELERLERQNGGTDNYDISLKNVPEAGLAYVRATRELKYREALFELLAKQYEAARIDEAKDAAIVQVLDRARPPEIRSSPHRTVMVLAITFVAFLVAIILAFLAEAREHLKSDPQFLDKLAILKFYFFRGLRSS